MRTVSEIQDEMISEGKKRDDYNNLYNEGATDGYNPHEDRLAELSQELLKSSQNESDKEWTKEVTNERRDWFNAQGFKTPIEALKGCRAKGFEISDLQTYAKKFPKSA